MTRRVTPRGIISVVRVRSDGEIDVAQPYKFERKNNTEPQIYPRVPEVRRRFLSIHLEHTTRVNIFINTYVQYIYIRYTYNTHGPTNHENRVSRFVKVPRV